MLSAFRKFNALKRYRSQLLEKLMLSTVNVLIFWKVNEKLYYLVSAITSIVYFNVEYPLLLTKIFIKINVSHIYGALTF
jgi:hypothetical protein